MGQKCSQERQLTIRISNRDPGESYKTDCCFFLPVSLLELQEPLRHSTIPVGFSCHVVAFGLTSSLSFRPEFLMALLPSQSSSPSLMCLNEQPLFHQRSKPESLVLSSVAVFPSLPISNQSWCSYLGNTLQFKLLLCPHCFWSIFLPPKFSCSISSDTRFPSQPLIEEMGMPCISAVAEWRNSGVILF